MSAVISKLDEGKTVEIESGKVKLDGIEWNVQWLNVAHASGEAKVHGTCLHIGIGDGMCIARVWACRYSNDRLSDPIQMP